MKQVQKKGGRKLKASDNHRGPKGMSGAMGVEYGQLEKTISFAMGHFMAKREDILLGGRPEPPEVTGYKIYIYYNGSGAEFWVRQENEKWQNWSYMEQ